MATNAAKELLTLMGTWKHELGGTTATVATQRGDSAQLGEALWQNQLAAVTHLLAVEAFIDSRDERGVYREFIRDLRTFVFAPDRGWQQGPAKLSGSTSLALHQLGQLMETSEARTLHLDSAEIEALQKAIDECLEILDSVAIPNHQGLQYLREVLRRLKEALEGGDIDLTVVRDQAYAAVGIAFLNHEALPVEERRSFFQKLSAIVSRFAGGTATGASGNLLSDTITTFLQIGL